MHLFRSIVRRALADWPVTLSAAILLLTAATVVAADGLYADAVTLGGVRDSLERAPPDDRNILISMRASAADVRAREPIVRSAIDDALATVGGQVVRQTDASWLEPIDGSLLNGQVSGLRSYEPIEAHAELSAGAWAVAGMQPMQATLPRMSPIG